MTIPISFKNYRFFLLILQNNRVEYGYIDSFDEHCLDGSVGSMLAFGVDSQKFNSTMWRFVFAQKIKNF